MSTAGTATGTLRCTGWQAKTPENPLASSLPEANRGGWRGTVSLFLPLLIRSTGPPRLPAVCGHPSYQLPLL